MSCAGKPIGAKADEHRSCDPTLSLIWDAGMDHRDERDNQSHRERVSGSDWRQGIPNRRTPLFLQSECHRKQPAHPGIYAMKGTEPKQRQPRPRLAHG